MTEPTPTPPVPTDTNIENIPVPQIGDEVDNQAIGRSYKRLKLAETATMLNRATSEQLGKEVAHHHSLVQGTARPAWVETFINELKNELKNEFFYPLMASNARIENRSVRSDNKTVLERGFHAVLLRVEKTGGPVAVGVVPSLEDLELDDDFVLSRQAIDNMDGATMDKFHNVYQDYRLRHLPGRSLEARRANLFKFFTEN